MYRFDPKTGKTAVFRDPSGRSNGLMFNQKGELIACEGANTGGGRRISITTGIDGAKDGTVKTLADTLRRQAVQQPERPGDRRQGERLFHRSALRRRRPARSRFRGGVPRRRRRHDVAVATRDVQKPNGILVSPDGKTVYVADNNPQGNRHLAGFRGQSRRHARRQEGAVRLRQRPRHRRHDARQRRATSTPPPAPATKRASTSFRPTRQAPGLHSHARRPDQLRASAAATRRGTLYITSANSKETDTKYGLFRIKLNAKGFQVVKLK